jgi:hypothetical protein
MALDLSDCQFQGPALPEPFVKLELEKELLRLKLLPKTTGSEGKSLAQHWDVYRRKLRELVASGGPLRVRNQVIEPLQTLLGYSRIEAAPDVQTREDLESGGSLLTTEDGKSRLRIWTTSFDEDLYAPSKRGRAYRYSHLRVAQRVLLASGERIGLLTNGVQLLVLISDPARPDSTITLPLDPAWKQRRDLPDSFRLLLALACPAGLAALPELVEKARLQQTRVTKELRKQAREAVDRFIQEILDHPANQEWLKAQPDHHALARTLWREGLVTVYRLLFLLKLEASDDLARSFSFASTSLWRNTFSPSTALAAYAHDVLEQGLETGTLLEGGLRALFRMFEEGLECTELVVKPLGGALFGAAATPTLSRLTWGERAVAWLLDRLLWTTQRRGEETRQRVHYGPLDVEDLGRVYEALLELEPGIASEPMCRLRRQKLEVVVPLAQGEKYRPADEPAATQHGEDENEETAEDETEDEEQPSRGKKTKVEWIEAIPKGRFYLRVGLGRKASGSYYTPHSFVRFLVQETLGPQVAERSPHDDPQPLKILEFKVLDPAMGSGHFLVEACRFLGDKLYEACRLCDEKALAAERRADKANKAEREKALAEAAAWRRRMLDIPDPDSELMKYLPSRSPEGQESGFSQQRAEALSRRLIATHCLYGVDKNPLAVELAKLALWLESHAEGMPLTFLDHRLVVGDSLTGPFWDKLIFCPGNPPEPIENLFNQGLNLKLSQALYEAIRYVHRLEATVGITVAEMREKEAMKAELDRALFPFRITAAAWSGGVMLGPEHCDDHAYADLLRTIANTGNLPERIESEPLRKMFARGLGIAEVPADRDMLCAAVTSEACIPALSYDLTFPEVFYRTGVPSGRQGFDAVLGNPPWEEISFFAREFLASYDIEILSAPTKRERESIETRLLTQTSIAASFAQYVESFEESKRLNDILFSYQKRTIDGQPAGRQLDQFRLFMERSASLLSPCGFVGLVVPVGFHVNDGAVGVRDLYFFDLCPVCCYSFEHKRLLFEISPGQRFDLIISKRSPTRPDDDVPIATQFKLLNDEWLFSEKRHADTIFYPQALIRALGGNYLNVLEFETPRDADIATRINERGVLVQQYLAGAHMSFNSCPHVLHTTHDAACLIPTSAVVGPGVDPRDAATQAAIIQRGFLPLHEKGTISQFVDRFVDVPRYCAEVSELSHRPQVLQNARYFRLLFRCKIHASEELKSVMVLIPPGGVSLNSNNIETHVSERKTADALRLLAVCNSFTFNYLGRLCVMTILGVTLFRRLFCPRTPSSADLLCAHSALRLTCNHAGYAPLWTEQLGDAWREAGKKPLTWPVLAGDDERWAARAAIDAVVADAYGLSRDQYVHVLATFSHASYKKAPDLCLARFDELKQIGLDAFTTKHDPYREIPLNENLPKPAIDLPLTADQEMPLLQTREAAPKKRGRKKA